MRLHDSLPRNRIFQVASLSSGQAFGALANEMLALSGRLFWQEESYDHLVRNEREFERIRFYIEHNPVRARLVMEADQ
jgi:hypothetical protein